MCECTIELDGTDDRDRLNLWQYIMGNSVPSIPLMSPWINSDGFLFADVNKFTSDQIDRLVERMSVKFNIDPEYIRSDILKGNLTRIKYYGSLLIRTCEEHNQYNEEINHQPQPSTDDTPIIVISLLDNDFEDYDDCDLDYYDEDESDYDDDEFD